MVHRMASKVRLFVKHPLGKGQSVPLSRDQSHYLFNVMRLAVGTQLSLFNGTDGEWNAEVAVAGKRNGVLTCDTQTKTQDMPPDLWLIFAPIKKNRTDFIVEKAVELGVRHLIPVQTDFTNERMRRDKVQAHAVEAAEQCGATFVPQVAELTKLARVLDAWDSARSILFCDEGLRGAPTSWPAALQAPAAILIGPEGGFSPTERARLHATDHAHAVSLGPRILRADTAAVAALTLWQSALGDW